jgi:hypothetical protein
MSYDFRFFIAQQLSCPSAVIGHPVVCTAGFPLCRTQAPVEPGGTHTQRVASAMRRRRRGERGRLTVEKPWGFTRDLANGPVIGYNGQGGAEMTKQILTAILHKEADLYVAE